MFTAVIRYEFEDADLNITCVGSEAFENEKEAKRFYFWEGIETVNHERWKWNETKKYYEMKSVYDDYDDDDRYGKKFHAYGKIIEIPDIDI